MSPVMRGMKGMRGSAAAAARAAVRVAWMAEAVAGVMADTAAAGWSAAAPVAPAVARGTV